MTSIQLRPISSKASSKPFLAHSPKCSAGWAGPGYDGVRVIAPDGTHIGPIDLPEVCSNLCFGGTDGKTLFMTATTQLYRIQTNVRDASHVLRQQAARDI